MDWGSPQTIKNIWIPGYEFGGPGSCKGDSGGPLIIYDQSEGPQRAKFVQIGVIQVIFNTIYMILKAGLGGSCGRAPDSQLQGCWFESYDFLVEYYTMPGP